jgi:LPXTG-motif cell wall-anchored protein
MACASCKVAALPGAKVTPCGSSKPPGGDDGFRLELWMIIAGGAAVLLLAVGLFVYFRRRRQQQDTHHALPLQYRALPEQTTQRLN